MNSRLDRRYYPTWLELNNLRYSFPIWESKRYEELYRTEWIQELIMSKDYDNLLIVLEIFKCELAKSMTNGNNS